MLDLGLLPPSPRASGLLSQPGFHIPSATFASFVVHRSIFPVLLMRDADSCAHRNFQCFCTSKVPAKGRDLTLESEAAIE